MASKLDSEQIRLKASGLHRCIDYLLKDAIDAGLITVALHLKLAGMELDEVLSPSPSQPQAKPLEFKKTAAGAQGA